MTDTNATAELSAKPAEQDEGLPVEFLEKLKASKRKRRIRIGAIAAVLVACLGAGAVAFNAFGSTDEQPEQTTGTYTQQVTQGDLEMTVEGSGTLSASGTTDVVAEVSGTVEKVSVSMGDEVEKGDTLFTISSDTLDEEIEEKYEAMVDAYEAYEEAASSSSNSTSSSSASSSNSTQDKSDSQSKSKSSGSQSDSQSSSSKSSSSKSSSSRSANTGSANTGSANTSSSSSTRKDSSSASTDAQSAAPKSDEANVKADEDLQASEQPQSENAAQPQTSASAQASTGTLIQAVYTLDSTTTSSAVATAGTATSATVAAGGGNSSSQAYSAYKQAKTAYEEAVASKEKLTVTAPCDGTVTELNVAKGDTVTADTGDNGSSSSSTAVVLSDMDKMTMTVSVSEYDINNIKKGQKATVTVKAVDKTVSAKVKSVSATASTSSSGGGGNSGSSGSTSYYEVTLVIPKPTSAMVAGMNATAEIVYESYEDALLVPAAAVSTDPQGSSYVTVDTGDGQTSQVSVTVLGSSDETSAVQGDLTAGQNVVVTYQVSSADSGSSSAQMGGMGNMGGMMGGMSGSSENSHGGGPGGNGGSGGSGGPGGEPPAGGPGGGSGGNGGN